MANPWTLEAYQNTGRSKDTTSKPWEAQTYVRETVPSQSGFNSTYTSSDETLYDKDLINDSDFVKASKILYQMNNSVDATPLADDVEYGKYGVEMMGWFNWNLPKMTLDASRIAGATEEQKRAFLYMMESYDDLGVSWNGAKRFFSGVLTDPTTYIGLSTFGVSTIVGKGAAQATKTGVKSLLNQSVKGGMIAGVEAGVYTAADDINRQVVETAVSGQDINLERTAKVAALGVAAGGVLGTAVTAGAKKLTAKSAAKQEAEAALVRASLYEDIAPGIRVKAGDRGNIGTVVSVVDDKVSVKFTSEAGAVKTKTFTQDQLTSVTKRKVPKLVDGMIDEKKLIDDIADLPPEVAAAQGNSGRVRASLDTVIKTIKQTVPGGKIVGVRANDTLDTKVLAEAVQPINEVLAKVANKDADSIAALMDTELTDAQAFALEVASNQTAFALKARILNMKAAQRQLSNNGDKEAAKAMGEQWRKIDKVLEPINLLDNALSTMSGRRLQARQQGGNTGLLRTLIGKDKTFSTVMAARLRNFHQQKEIKDLKVKIEAARQKGDIAGFVTSKKELMNLETALEKTVAKEEGGIFNQLYANINKPIKIANEVMISFVFSPATVIINTVPSMAKVVYKPFLNNVMKNGLTKTALKTTMAEYSAMASFAPTALKAAGAAWKYERSMLTGDSARFLEDYNAIPKKFGGGVLRFFPRLLLSTDALFENVHYRGYAVGKATSEAMEEGLELGLKGKALDAHVATKVDEALKDAYEPTANAIDILMDDGMSRGLSGKDLDNHIKEELAKNPEAFSSATDKAGRDYVQDVLFKRDFSGEGAASQLAKGYEGFVNRHPVMRIAGQLFFRTPVRVFEEGMRLTPGLNLISPGFLADLSGKNGDMRQVRAQGEALMSYAIAGSVFSLYSTGNVTGSLGEDYKKRRQVENAAGVEPYSIRFSDGSTFNYRNFDPFSTPVKIIVNALERAEILAYRKEQGERINESDMMAVQAMVSVAVGSIAQSIRDANLASGVDAMFTLTEDLQDPEGSEQLIKFAGQKVQTFLPNTYYKFQMLDNPVLADPVSMEQFIRYRINPDDPLVPKQYTALGRARTLANPIQGLMYFNRTTNAERERGVPQKELEVEEFLQKLSIVGDTHFTAPYIHKFLPNVDLRTRLTTDGKESLYDRWMRYTHQSGVIDAIHGLRDLPMGTASVPGMAESEAKTMLNAFREMAFVTLMSEEQGIDEEYIKAEIRKIEAKAGNRYIPNTPIN